MPAPGSGRGPDWPIFALHRAHRRAARRAQTVPPLPGTPGWGWSAPGWGRWAGLGWGPLRLPAQLGFRHPPPYGIPLSFSIAGSRTPPCSVHARPRFGDGSRPDPGFGPPRRRLHCVLSASSFCTSPLFCLLSLPRSPCRVPMGAAIPACPLACVARSHHRTTRPTSHPRPSRNTRLHTPLTPTSINNTSSTSNTRNTSNTPSIPNTLNTRRRANTPTTSSPRPRHRSTTSPASRMPPDRRCPRCRALASALRRRARCSSSRPRSATSSSP